MYLYPPIYRLFRISLSRNSMQNRCDADRVSHPTDVPKRARNLDLFRIMSFPPSPSSSASFFWTSSLHIVHIAHAGIWLKNQLRRSRDQAAAASIQVQAIFTTIDYKQRIKMAKTRKTHCVTTRAALKQRRHPADPKSPTASMESPPGPTQMQPRFVEGAWSNPVEVASGRERARCVVKREPDAEPWLNGGPDRRS